jgi:hypothetical protein
LLVIPDDLKGALRSLIKKKSEWYYYYSMFGLMRLGIQ